MSELIFQEEEKQRMRMGLYLVVDVFGAKQTPRVRFLEALKLL
jgi:hypothetical protein